MRKLKHLLLFLIAINTMACNSTGTNENNDNGASEVDNSCETTSLLPHIYAEMCLPKGCDIKDSEDYNSESNSEYKFVTFNITLPSGEVIYVRELAKQDGIEDILNYRRTEIESEIPESEIHESSKEYFIQKTKEEKYIVHFFKDTYGWPYLLKTSELKSLDDVKVIIGYFNTFKFT